MISILVAGGVSLFVALFLTPFLIRVLSRQGLGHEIRIEGPQSHQGKRGTPSMGGIAIIAGMWAGYLAAHIIGFGSRLPRLSASGWLVLAPAVGLLGNTSTALAVTMTACVSLGLIALLATTRKSESV